jgi:hypothetical protein
MSGAENHTSPSSRPTWIELLGWSAVYLVVRFTRLTAIPIFFDEAVYLRWAQEIVREGASPFVSLSEGIPPSLVWLAAPLVGWLPDPLVAGRCVTVAAGLATLLGVYRLLEYSAGRAAARAGAMLVITSPMLVVYDRLAVYEALVAAEVAWLWFFGVRYLDRGTWPDLLGVVTVSLLGGLTKSSVLVAVLGLGASALLVARRGRAAGLLIALAAGFVAAAVAMSPWAEGLAKFNVRAGEGLTESIRLLDKLPHMLGLHLAWLGIYLTPLPLILAAAAGVWKPAGLVRQLPAALAVELVAMAVLVPRDQANPRYLVLLAPVVLALAALALERVRSRKWIARILWAGMLIPAAANSATLIIEPTHAVLLSTERLQLITGSPSGYGLRETVAYVQRLHPDNDYWLLVEGTSPHLTRGLRLYLPPERVLGTDPRQFLDPDSIAADLPGANTYLITHEFQPVLRARSLELLAQFPKPERQYSIRLYRCRGSENSQHSRNPRNAGQ